MKLKRKIALAAVYLVISIFALYLFGEVSEYRRNNQSEKSVIYEITLESNDEERGDFESLTLLSESIVELKNDITSQNANAQKIVETEESENSKSDEKEIKKETSVNSKADEKELKNETSVNHQTRTEEIKTGFSARYIVEKTDGGYLANSGESSVFEEKLSALVNKIEDNGVSIEFKNVFSDEGIVFTKSVTLSGDLTLSGANMSLSGEKITLADFSFVGLGASIRVKGGVTESTNAKIRAFGNSALLIDFHSSARFVMLGGVIYSESAAASLVCELGTAELKGGEIKNLYGAAVENKSSLSVSREALISGLNFDVVTDRPIALLSGVAERENPLKVMYKKSFAKGSFSVAFLGADSSDTESILLFDESGEKMPLRFFEECRYTEEKNVLAVYLPHTVKYYSETELFLTEYFISGEGLTEPNEAFKEGYSFVGWYRDSFFSEPYVFGTEEMSDFSLYAKFELLLPEFSLSSFDFVYDGKRRYLAFDYLYHPLMEKGSFSFVWYKDNEPIKNGASMVSVTEVKDSGSYFCKLTFSYCSDFVTVCTPSVTVSIEKATVQKPEISPIEYTGKTVLIPLESTKEYRFDTPDVSEVGIYYLTLTLTDSLNFKWAGEDGENAIVPFEIVKAENAFLESPTAENIYEGEPLNLVYKLRFGEGIAEYSSDGETWYSDEPKSAGIYYFRIVESGCENYGGAISEAVKFEIYSEVCTGIKIDKYPTKTEYIAFEKIDLSGAEITASYNSGRSEKIDLAELSVGYKNGSCFLVSDSSATLTFGACSVPIPVSVLPAEYDISSIVFNDIEAVYNGLRHTAEVSASIVGKDGIPLCFKVLGGGIDVGAYSLTLTFSSDSINYSLPEPIKRTLVINPCPLVVEYGKTEFVYDGLPKLPTAKATGAGGVPVSVSLVGASVDAGEYMATATVSDSNYILENANVIFKILKADFDLSSVHWSETSFVYNGEAKSVSVLGLPNGITLLGYANATFVEAGRYTAEVAISFDEKNFNHPGSITQAWEIKRRDYELDGFRFSDAEYTFDESVHYPAFSGSMPKGIDGIELTYRFSLGATHVAEGKKAVIVSFETISKNYNTPLPLTLYVTIHPMPIEIEWENESFIYDGNSHIPTANSEKCKLKITNSAINAGTYTAFAETLDSDYKVLNNEKVFTIFKAENKFITDFSAIDVYFGDEPKLFAEAFFGSVNYKIYDDEALKISAKEPLSVGKYYAVAEVEESENYLKLTSDALVFSVLEILPVSLEIELTEPLFAMKNLEDFAFAAYLLNNNGTKTPLAKNELAIEYQNGNSFKASDTRLTVIARGFSKEIEISVSKSAIELPDISPLVYSGEVQFPSALVSPLFTTDFSGAKDAGEYLISFVLSDSENYEFKNGKSTLLLVITKAPITLAVNKNGSSYEIKEGKIFYSDELSEEYYEENGKIYVKIANPNYELTVIPREDKNALGYVLLAFALALSVLFASLGFYIAFGKGQSLAALTPMRHSKASPRTKALENTIDGKRRSQAIEPPLETLLAVDEAYANNLISDLVAKSLITDEDVTVETDGKRRCILNIDTISENFSAGETVNINDFKRKGLIPSDAKYVKILARGVIDKPIHVQANAFSLSAVKMIALTGGSAVRVKTGKWRRGQ